MSSKLFSQFGLDTKSSTNGIPGPQIDQEQEGDGWNGLFDNSFRELYFAGVHRAEVNKVI